jgi:cytochrome P450
MKFTSNIPSHIPSALVYDFDYISATKNAGSDPFSPLLALDPCGAPDFFWSPLLGGHWVARRYADVIKLFQDHEHFATHPLSIPPMQGQPTKMIPLEIDPPDHQRYRQIMGRLFTPAATLRIEAEIRKHAAALIEKIAEGTQTDFVETYADRFPPLVFLGLMDMPTDRIDEFVSWASASLVGEPHDQAAAGQNIISFIYEYVERKYNQTKTSDDWISTLIDAKDPEGAPALTRAEIVDISYFLFLAGLDTILNSLAHIWRYLAEHSVDQHVLRNNPGMIPNAVEEFLRFNTVATQSRTATQDLIFRGIEIKKGEAVLLLSAVANRDPVQFENGERVDFTRDPNRHLTFGAGVHRCLGSNIARLELRVSLEEWFKRIPPFRLKENTALRATGGVTMGLEKLPLVWGS